jgi:hypothetical protein
MPLDSIWLTDSAAILGYQSKRAPYALHQQGPSKKLCDIYYLDLMYEYLVVPQQSRYLLMLMRRFP